MSLYSYVKKKPFPTKKIVSIVSILFILAGIGIFIWTLLPILSFEIYYAPKFGQLIEPVPFQEAINREFSKVLGTSIDYTKASAWFPKTTMIKSASINSSYLLSIPKIGIENANVLVGADDLSQSLIQFSGPLPGNLGNSIIFGHSTLPWLYNPKNYKTIFTKLADLEIDDNIFILSDNITYKFSVFEMKIISPDNLSILEQHYDYPAITLITCVPPGTYLKRLIVKAKLVAF